LFVREAKFPLFFEKKGQATHLDSSGERLCLMLKAGQAHA